MRFKRPNQTNTIQKKSQFKNDSKFEVITHNWLIEHDGFNELNVIEHVSDKERQMDGIDMVSSQYQNIDAKAISTDLSTFCFEICGNIHSPKEGVESGWLFKSHSSTNYYLLEYFYISQPSHSIQQDKEAIIAEEGRNIEQCEMYLIARNSLQKMVANYFLLNNKSPRDLAVFNEVRNYHPKDMTTYYTVRDRHIITLQPRERQRELMYLAVSGKLREAPLNVVVKKDFLRAISEKRIVVN